ncbi:hypothetical protein ACOJBO_02050 [Rhizobium beringeri]
MAFFICSTLAKLRVKPPIDVEALGCDILTATGRKFLRAPRELAMYMRKSLLETIEGLR